MFLKIQAENFMSWEKLDFSIPAGCTLIEGVNHDDGNSEGAGKSAILNALCWGLYGKLPKDTKVDDVIRVGTSGCSVRIETTVGTIFRSRHPNELYIQKGSKRVGGKDAKETQALIDSLMGMGFDTFCQAVYFPQNWDKKFLLASESDRGKILADIQDTRIFDAARKEAHSRLTTATALLQQIQREQQILSGNWTNLGTQIEETEALKEEFLEYHKKQRDTVKDAIAALEHKLSALLTSAASEELLEKQLSKLDKTLEEVVGQRAEIRESVKQVEQKAKMADMLDREIAKKEIKLDKLRTELESYTENPSAECPTCGTKLTDISASHKRQMLEAARGKLLDTQNELAEAKRERGTVFVPESGELEELLDKLNEKYDSIRDKRTNTEEDLDKLLLAKQRRRDAAQELESKQQELNQLRNTPNVDKYDKSLRNLSAEQEKVSTRLTQITTEIEALRVVTGQLEMLKIGFKEVKSYIFRELLAELTRRANIYLAQLFEVPIKLQFTNAGDEGEISKIMVFIVFDGEERSLGLFSGGQTRRIQLAVDLALSDIVTSRAEKAINIRILDEYMKDLSEESMERVLRLLENLKGSTLLIEHNSIFRNIVNNVVTVHFKDGVSRAA